jgi:hypothetical protein
MISTAIFGKYQFCFSLRKVLFELGLYWNGIKKIKFASYIFCRPLTPNFISIYSVVLEMKLANGQTGMTYTLCIIFPSLYKGHLKVTNFSLS